MLSRDVAFVTCHHSLALRNGRSTVPCRALPQPQQPHSSTGEGRRPTLSAALLASTVAAAAAVGSASRSARAESSSSSLKADYTPQRQKEKGFDTEQRRLELEDPELKELRRIESSLRLYDLKAKRFVGLDEALQPGQPLHDADAVFVGELHDSASDHAVQRVILDAFSYRQFLELRKAKNEDVSSMQQVTPQNDTQNRVALGVEYFSGQQQKALDEFVFMGRQKLADFKTAIDWDNVWSYDWSLYAPLFRLCQLNNTQMVGLNLPMQVVLDVSRNGMDAQPDWLKDLLPPLDLSQPRHRRRFEDMLKMPVEKSVERWSTSLDGYTPDAKLDKMYEGQTLWDEHMGNSAARYLTKKGGRLIGFAGINHVWRDAIPNRFEKAAAKSGQVKKAVAVVPWRKRDELSSLPAMADYAWSDDGPGGGLEVMQALEDQRKRLAGKSRIFPAGFV
eukprot:TRINITY_DN24423_c0_g1_i1.p1 TRINITY_DN24423_c0_g1~~TRINITY_DN24423_c0_g1_i1.p1  ORF type:complete len:448 (+),score=114.25 TRINITY_DN24423_c0_g1_i1:76-1419(+)